MLGCRRCCGVLPLRCGCSSQSPKSQGWARAIDLRQLSVPALSSPLSPSSTARTHTVLTDSSARRHERAARHVRAPTDRKADPRPVIHRPKQQSFLFAGTATAVAGALSPALPSPRLPGQAQAVPPAQATVLLEPLVRRPRPTRRPRTAAAARRVQATPRRTRHTGSCDAPGQLGAGRGVVGAVRMG